MEAYIGESTFPPSLEGYPLIAMLVVAAFWACSLICLRWLWEVLETNREFHAPRETYIAIQRRSRVALILGLVCLSAPRLAQLMLWQSLSPGGRAWLSSVTWLLILPATWLLARAWWLDKRMVATERTYVRVNGFVNAPEQTVYEKRRLVMILSVIMLIAFATTFVRPASERSPATAERSAR